jgi:class 3 adenylate cyclase
MIPLHVLIVEDSEGDADLILAELRRGGYDPIFERVETGAAMNAALGRKTWDVVLADYTLPHFSAPAALRLVKDRGIDIPFIVVSGSIGEETAVAAMKAGAQDYFFKGHLRRLVPAVERELRDAEERVTRRGLEAQRRLFEQMVSPAIIDSLTTDGLRLGGKRTEITVLFADLRGFTRVGEHTEPEELVSMLNRYLTAAADAILGQGGTIDKFLGDAVMAWFNAPLSQPDHTWRAVRAALDLHHAAEVAHQDLPVEHRLSFSVGLHVGPAVLGLIGTERRMEYTAIGQTVNAAKRLEEHAPPGQILMSADLYARVAPHVDARPVKPIVIKGRDQPLPAYKVIGIRDVGAAAVEVAGAVGGRTRERSRESNAT